MPRVKRSIIHLKKRRKILRIATGYMWRRSNLWKQAKVAVKRAGVFSYRDRRVRRREFRKLWQVRLNAAVRPHGLSYSRFISMLKKANVGLDRKILSTIALKNPEIFAKILWKIRS